MARACEANFLPNSWGLLQHLGLQHRNRVLVAEDPNIGSAELAYALRLSVVDVMRRRYEALPRNHFDFFGLDLHGDRLDKRVRRFSPIALREGQFHRAMWELRDIPFCLEGWDMLQDTCWCETKGVVQGWVRTHTKVHECDRCGDPLSWIEPVRVPVEMKQALSILKAIADPVPSRRDAEMHALPNDLRNVERSMLYHTVRQLANAIEPFGGTRSWEDPESRLKALHAACLALTNWPRGLDEVTWHEETTPSAIEAVRYKWRRLAVTGVEAITSKGWRPSAYARIARKPSTTLFLGIRPASELARLDAASLIYAWESGLVTQHSKVYGERSLRAFDRRELPEFADRWRHRVPADRLARDMNISLHGVEQLVALDVLKAAPARPGTGLHLTPESVEAFLAAIHSTRCGEEGLTHAVKLAEAVSKIGGRMKPWGAIFKAFLDREIPFDLVEGEDLIHRIVVSRSSVRAIAEITFDRADHMFAFEARMKQGDAYETLNVSGAKSRLLSGLDALGTNPKTYSVKDVEARAAMIASTPEIAARLGLELWEAVEHARSNRWPEIIPGGWDRNKLERAVALRAGSN